MDIRARGMMMTSRSDKDGGPAFPAMHFDLGDGEHGMTLRDYFAAKAIPAVIASLKKDLNDQLDFNLSSDDDGEPSVDAILVAEDAYGVADAMLRVRDR